MAGWKVNQKRVQPISRAESLKVPKQQPKRGRARAADGSCVRLRPTTPATASAYDFLFGRTHDGGPLTLLLAVNDHTRQERRDRTIGRAITGQAPSGSGEHALPYFAEPGYDGDVAMYGVSKSAIDAGQEDRDLG